MIAIPDYFTADRIILGSDSREEWANCREQPFWSTAERTRAGEEFRGNRVSRREIPFWETAENAISNDFLKIGFVNYRAIPLSFTEQWTKFLSFFRESLACRKYCWFREIAFSMKFRSPLRHSSTKIKFLGSYPKAIKINSSSFKNSFENCKDYPSICTAFFINSLLFFISSGACSKTQKHYFTANSKTVSFIFISWEANW